MGFYVCIMIHTYKISGMTCGGCKSTVQGLLSRVPGIKNVTIDLAKSMARVEMDGHVNTKDLLSALKDYPKYDIAELNEEVAQKQSILVIYKPIFLVFAFILGITLLVELTQDGFNWMRWMNYFMSGFFLVFSFFKMLDLKSFAESYATYDILARKWMGWGYIYAFIELGLGISFLTGVYPLVTNAITFMVMSVSIIGVLQSVLNRRQIKCACLGAVFNLPMSKITIIEDGLMILMSLGMILLMIFGG